MLKSLFLIIFVGLSLFAAEPAPCQNYPTNLVVDNSLWYFSSSGTPGNYPTSTNATALTDGYTTPTVGGTYTWTLSDSNVSFSPSSSVQVITTGTNSVQIYALGPSASGNSPVLTFQWNPPNSACGSPTSGQAYVPVNSPSYATNFGTAFYGSSGTCDWEDHGTGASYNAGYIDLIQWRTFDKLNGQPMPGPFYVNESLYNFNYDNASYHDYGPPTPGGGPTGDAGAESSTPGDWADKLCQTQDPEFGKNPEPTAYTGQPDFRVAYESQHWCVANQVMNYNYGATDCYGKDILADQQNFYNDMGLVSGIQSPD